MLVISSILTYIIRIYTPHRWYKPFIGSLAYEVTTMGKARWKPLKLPPPLAKTQKTVVLEGMVENSATLKKLKDAKVVNPHHTSILFTGLVPVKTFDSGDRHEMWCLC